MEGCGRERTNKEINKAARITTKLAVTEAKMTTFERLYVALGDKEGDKKLYWLAKMRERKDRYQDQVECIKNEDDKILTDDILIKQRW